MTVSSRYTLESLPEELPIFPLEGVLLLPRGLMPLNIFETRYLAMVDDAMAGNRLIGLIQPREDGTLYDVGCAGRVTSYTETSDGRYEIVLTGIVRFRLGAELPQKDGYRRAAVDFKTYAQDLEPKDCLGMDRTRLKKLLKAYFEQQDITCRWDAVDNTPDERLMATLAMVCPFGVEDKQALLEAMCCKERANMFMGLLEMECCGDCDSRH